MGREKVGLDSYRAQNPRQICHEDAVYLKFMSTENRPDKRVQSEQQAALLQRIVRSYSWCAIPPSSWNFLGPDPEYLIVIQLPDGRRYWRCLICATANPDQLLLRWATGYSSDKWFAQFKEDLKPAKQRWNHYFDFWEPAKTCHW